MSGQQVIVAARIAVARFLYWKNGSPIDTAAWQVSSRCFVAQIVESFGLLNWVFPKIGVPQNGWFIMENPIKRDDLGGKPYYFWQHPIRNCSHHCDKQRCVTLRMMGTWLGKELISSDHEITKFFYLQFFRTEVLPSRELTYPTLGKGKSSSKCHFWGICQFPGGYFFIHPQQILSPGSFFP